MYSHLKKGDWQKEPKLVQFIERKERETIEDTHWVFTSYTYKPVPYTHNKFDKLVWS